MTPMGKLEIMASNPTPLPDAPGVLSAERLHFLNLCCANSVGPASTVELFKHIAAREEQLRVALATIAALMPLRTDQVVPAEHLIGIGKGLRDAELGNVRPFEEIETEANLKSQLSIAQRSSAERGKQLLNCERRLAALTNVRNASDHDREAAESRLAAMLLVAKDMDHEYECMQLFINRALPCHCVRSRLIATGKGEA
jgi:hypothetical protein